MKRTSRVGVGAVRAECQACPWDAGGHIERTSAAMWATARRHAASNPGHTVHVLSSHIVTAWRPVR